MFYMSVNPFTFRPLCRGWRAKRRWRHGTAFWMIAFKTTSGWGEGSLTPCSLVGHLKSCSLLLVVAPKLLCSCPKNQEKTRFGLPKSQVFWVAKTPIPLFFNPVYKMIFCCFPSGSDFAWWFHPCHRLWTSRKRGQTETGEIMTR